MPQKWLWIAVITFCTAALLMTAILCEAVRLSDAHEPDNMQDQAYRIIGVWNGRVAVYIPQTDTPETVYDTAVASLPEEEQRRLYDGVAVSDRVGLSERLEDYVS